MWVDTYDYVRLHQPHPFFTAGDVAWTPGQPLEHLASETEVLEHLRHCVEEARQGVQVTELLGHEFESAEEDGDVVSIAWRGSAGPEDPPYVSLSGRVLNVGLSLGPRSRSGWTGYHRSKSSPHCWSTLAGTWSRTSPRL